MSIRNYNYTCQMENYDPVELVVSVSPGSRVVQFEGKRIGEIIGWGGRGYKVKNAPMNSNHKSIGSAANEAYYLHLIKSQH